MQNQETNPVQVDSGDSGSIIQLVCFMLAGEEYALDITSVQEVLRVQKITPVPQMPEFVLGVVNIRGNVIPVFDLRKKFHLPEKTADAQSKIMILHAESGYISILVDKIVDNIKLDSTHIDPSPNVKMKMQRDCVTGVGLFYERIIIMLDLKKVHAYILQDIKEYKEKRRAFSAKLNVVA